MTSCQTHRKVVAEPKYRIHRPTGLNADQRQMCPHWELQLEQAAHQSLVDIDLVEMHLGHHQNDGRFHDIARMFRRGRWDPRSQNTNPAAAFEGTGFSWT